MNEEKRVDVFLHVNWCRLPWLYIAVLFLIVGTNSVASGHGPFYFRAGAGIASSGNAVFSDVACDSDSGLALFGCSVGNDGRPIGAYGDFGKSTVLEGAIGYRWNNWFSTELTLTDRAGFHFQGLSNFSQLDPSIEQGVEGDAHSFSAIFSGVIRPRPLSGKAGWRLDPFIAGGIGLARNNIDAMVYTFPVTQTITPSGYGTAFAWSMGAGFRVDLSADVQLEIRYRYADLGSIRTDMGIMTIRSRPSGEIINDTITINGTKADLTVRETLVSVIWSF